MPRNSEYLASMSSTPQHKARLARLDNHVAWLAAQLEGSETPEDASSDLSRAEVITLPRERFTAAELERF